MAGAAGGPALGRGDDFYRAFLTGYGALFFAPAPAAGALFLLGTFAASAVVGTAILLGLLSSTFAAHLLRRDRAEIEQGLYGFNGALVAFALFSLEGRTDLLYALVVPAAALTARLTAWALDGVWSGRLGLPALSGPSLLVGYPLLAALVRWGGYRLHPGAVMASYLGHGDLFGPAFYGEGMRGALGPVTGAWPVALLFALGFALHSRRLLLLVAAGLATGAVIGFALLGWVGATSFGFVVVTATPVFVALAGVFTAGGWRGWLFGGAAAALSFLVWFHGGIWLADHGQPLFTLPFFASVIGALLLLRFAPARLAGWLPERVPLHRIGSPETAARWADGRAQGLRWWQDVARLGERSWQDFVPAERLARARELVRRSTRVTVLTGAGISTESGIPDYRSGAVAWKHYDTTHFRWERFLAAEESRRRYWEMSQDFFLVLRTAQPNAGHRAIAALERQGKLRAVITQNVDRLHQAAGVPPEKVIEIHGNEHRVSCLGCGAGYPREEVYRWIVEGVPAPYCPACQGILKPDSTAFGQPMDEEASARALRAVEECDLLVVAGTSLEVQPVATLPLVALRAGRALLVVNLQATDYDPFADFVLRGTCGALLPQLLGDASLEVAP